MSDVIPNADRDAFHKLFEGAPDDPFAAYGAMADLMDEIGYASLAHAYRWMMHRGKRPHKRTHYVGDLHEKKVPEKFRWAWYAQDEFRESSLGGLKEVPNVLPGSRLRYHSLPPLLLPGTQKVYPSHAAAVMDLAKWLQCLKDTHDLAPPKKGL